MDDDFRHYISIADIRGYKCDWDKANLICEEFKDGWVYLLFIQYPSIYKFINSLSHKKIWPEDKITSNTIDEIKL